MRVAFGRFTFDTATRELLEGGTRVHLSPKAFDVLRLLLERRPAVVSKREIHDHIWQDTFVGEANLSVVVAEIRQVLGEDSRHAAFIRTVHRVGYAFSGPAHTLPAATATGEQPDALCWLVRNDRAFPLRAGANLVGRDPRCTVWVDASGVSRRHARVDVGAETTIVDLESINGTFVGGQRVTDPKPLVDGDVIELGSAALTFRAWSDASAARTERVARRDE